MSKKTVMPAEAVESLLSTALAHYCEGRLDQSARILETVAQWSPNEARAWKLLGSIMMLTDRRREAEKFFLRAHALEPTDPYVLVALAELRINFQRVFEGIEFIEKILRDDPEGKHPATARARLLIESAIKKLEPLK